MIDIITTRSGQRKIIFKNPINQLVKKRANKNNSTSYYKFYTCALPLSLKKYLGYTDKIYYTNDGNNIRLSPTPTNDAYTIKKNGVISIPSKYFNGIGKYNEVHFVVDLNRSVDMPYVLMVLK